MRDWTSIREWRKSERERLLAERRAMSAASRRDAAEAIGLSLGVIVAERRPAIVGGYWPIKSELDFRFLWEQFCAQGIAMALPVVVEPRQPLQYWHWQPGMAMERGFWNIPVPATREAVKPGLVIAPLVGFDDQGYRLGYGGGYFDRTLAALQPRPFAVGAGLETMRLATIHPQPHDIPMTLIVTEKGIASSLP